MKELATLAGDFLRHFWTSVDGLPIARFFELCAAETGLYVIGGAPRSFLFGKPINDYDILLDLSNDKVKSAYDALLAIHVYTTNKYGGIAIEFAGLKFEMWDGNQSWFAGCLDRPDTLAKISARTVLNIDSIVIKLFRHSAQIYLDNFRTFLASNMIDFCFDPADLTTNTGRDRFAAKAVYLSQAYDCGISANLQQFATGYEPILLEVEYDQHFRTKDIDLNTFKQHYGLTELAHS